MRVILVEDHATFRESLAIALSVRGGFEVKGSVASARDALPLVEKERPDVLVADMMLTDTDAIALVRDLRRRRALPPTMILSRVDHPVFVRNAFEAGALGFALKDDPLDEVVRGIERVARREPHRSPSLSSSEEAPSMLDTLSPREREVFGRMLEGLTAKEIARALCVSVKTVHTHRLQINRKLGVRSPVQFARFTAAEGFLRR